MCCRSLFSLINDSKILFAAYINVIIVLYDVNPKSWTRGIEQEMGFLLWQN